MDDGYPLISILLFLLFVVLEAIFYGFGCAIQNFNIALLEKDSGEGKKKAGKLLHIVDSPDSFVRTLQIATNLMGMITGAFVLLHLRNQLELVFLQHKGLSIPFRFLSIGSLVVLSIFLMLILVCFGIVIPKQLAMRSPQKWAYVLLPFVRFLMLPVLPFSFLVNVISNGCLRLFGIDPKEHSDSVTEEDIMSMVNEGHEQGILEASEAEMITKIFELDEKEAIDIMTHRTNLTAIDGSMTLSQVISFILKEGSNSRYPVYEKELDNIIGILHMKEALIFGLNQELVDHSIKDIHGILREANLIPETRNIKDLFREMQSEKNHMMIVVDEYGQISGIVTMEDILEEIVGNILDEFDIEEESIILMEDGSYCMGGMTLLEEITKKIGICFEEEDYESFDTVNGFLTSKLSRLPKEDEEIEVQYGIYHFKILQVENKMIHTVKVIKNADEES